MADVDPSLVSSAVVDLIRSVVDPVAVGHGTAPTPADGKEDSLAFLQAGFIVVNRLVDVGGSGMTPGFRDQPDQMREIRYSLIGGGVTAEQAEYLSHQACHVLVEADGADAEYSYDLVVPGHIVHRRVRVSDGHIPKYGPSFQAVTVVSLVVSSEV